MELLNKVAAILKRQQRNLTWLASEVDWTYHGLKKALKTGSLKYNDLIIIAGKLKVPIEHLVSTDSKNYSINAGDNSLIANDGSSFFNEYGKNGENAKSKNGFEAEISRLNTELHKCNAELIAAKNDLIQIMKKRK